MIRLAVNSSHLHKRPRTREKGVHTLVSIIIVGHDRAERCSVIGMSGNVVVHGGDEVAEGRRASGVPV